MLKVRTGKYTGWCGVYLSSKDKEIAYFGLNLDIFGGLKPQFFGMVGDKSLTINIPYMKWKPNGSVVRNTFYKVQSKFWNTIVSID